MTFPDYRYPGYGPTDSYNPGRKDFNRDRGRDRDRDRDRDRSRDRDRDWDRDTDRPPPRRDSRDMRESNTRDLFERDSRRPMRRASDQLHLDTRVPTGPRASDSAKNSPISARSTLPPKPPLPESFSEKRSAATMANASPITTPASPSISGTGTRPTPQHRTKDPRLQQTFEAVWSCAEASQKRSHYRFRRDKMKRELMLQQRWVEKQSEKDDDFAGLPDYQNTFNKGVNKDLEELNKRVSESDKQYYYELERIAALFQKASSGSTQQVSTPTTAAAAATKDSPSNNAWEKEFAEFKKQFSTQFSAQQKQIDEQAQQIQTLQDEKNQLSAQQKQVAEQAQQLQTLLDWKNTAKETLDTLRSDANTHKKRVSTLGPDIKSLKDRAEKLEAAVSRLDQDAKNSEKKRLDLESNRSSLIAAKSASSDLIKLDASVQKSLKELRDRLADQEVAYKKLRAEVDRLTSQQNQASAVNGVKQENSDLKQKLETLVGMKTTVDELKEDVRDLKEMKDNLPSTDELDKVMNYWYENDIERSFKTPEDIVENTQRELQKHEESIAELKRELTRTRASASAPSPAPAPVPAPAQPALSEDQKAYIAKQNATLMASVQELLETQEGALADMVDEVGGRVGKLEIAQNTSITTTNQLSVRVQTIEDQKLLERYNELVDMGKHLHEELQKAGIGQAGLYGQDQVKADIDVMKEKIEMIEVCSKTLDTQWSNMQTKGMAELILAQLNPYGQRHDAIIQQLLQEFRQVRAEVKEVMPLVSGLINEVNGSKKRTASPANGVMPHPMKRPRVELNGQQQQQQQPPHQQRPSPSSRHSSVGQENFQPR